MNLRAWTGSRQGRVVIAAASLLMLTLGFACLLDRNHGWLDEHGPSMGLCAAVAALSLAVALFTGPCISGRLRPLPTVSLHLLWLHPPDPPPKPLPA